MEAAMVSRALKAVDWKGVTVDNATSLFIDITAPLGNSTKQGSRVDFVTIPSQFRTFFPTFARYLSFSGETIYLGMDKKTGRCVGLAAAFAASCGELPLERNVNQEPARRVVFIKMVG